MTIHRSTLSDCVPLVHHPRRVRFFRSSSSAAQNKRADYLDAFFNVINWRRVSANYMQFASQGQAVPCTQGDLLAAPPPAGGELVRF